jgi:hypothetical protein
MAEILGWVKNPFLPQKFKKSDFSKNRIIRAKKIPPPGNFFSSEDFSGAEFSGEESSERRTFRRRIIQRRIFQAKKYPSEELSG